MQGRVYGDVFGLPNCLLMSSSRHEKAPEDSFGGVYFVAFKDFP
jgi:hypothetical protein